MTRPITKTRKVTFGAGCRECPLRALCTTAKSGRTPNLHQHHGLLRDHRKRAKDPAGQAAYRQHRPMVERSIAWLVAGGNRKVRYRGVTKNNAWLHNRTAALNLRRLLNLGLIRQHEAWALARVQQQPPQASIRGPARPQDALPGSRLSATSRTPNEAVTTTPRHVTSPQPSEHQLDTS